MGADETTAPLDLTLDVGWLARQILTFCVLAEAAFVILDYHINFGRLVEIGAVRRMFNIAREDGLASWFGTTQTLLTGLTLWVIYVAAKRRRGPRWRTTGWLVLAVFFTYMAIDDGAEIHERLGSTYKAIKEDAGESLGFFPSYTWQLILGPVFGALGLFLFGFLWHELREKRARILTVTALSCWVAAVGMDFVEGLDEEHEWNVVARLAEYDALDDWTEARFDEDAYDTLRHFSKSIEEAIEMLGMSLLWFVFIRHLATAPGQLAVRFFRSFPASD